ncbi:hypothetical protein G6F55_003422 [Rhizopus delemar]|nr:hypothetical protein G6F55_003422 [Rhizopus delemar]
MAEEMVYVGRKKIVVYSIDKLLEGEVPKKYSHKPAITIPPIRNAKNDLEFLNMFPENLEAIHELQLAVQEFIDTYVYIKGYNKTTVERIQHMYMKTYRTILQKNKLLQDSCRTPSEHDRFLELVENVVMSFLHKKIWIQTLQQLLESQDNYLDSICCVYSHVVLSQYSLRYPLSEMHVSCFYDAISNFQRIDIQAITPLEKLAVLRSTLDLISVAVRDYVKHFGHSTSDTSVTSDEMIPLLAFIIVQSHVPRKASLIYYMQHYRLARMIEGSVYSFVLATMKSACEFLKDDPLSLHDMAATQRSRSVSFQHEPKSSDLLLSHHRKSQSADFHTETGPHILRPHIVLPSTNSSTSSHSDHRKSLEIPDHWVVYQSSSSSSTNTRHIQKQSLGASKPMFSTIVPSLSTNLYPTKLGRSLSASPTTTRKCPPEVIHVPERLDPIKRPASMIDTVSDDGMGDFLNSLSQLDGDVVGERTGSIKSLNYIPL